ncbi:hypothetical protein, partial [Azonexus sp.]|uniref:hypothetical protein n=1 Tax=Azonexus sp. TaxID=1872668 RepID=UPI0035B16EDC
QSEPGSNSSVQSNKLANSLTVDFSTSMDCSIFFTSAFALIHCVTEVTASRHPHLSVVQTFKDQFRRAVAFASSAAEKRDYEQLPAPRQVLQQFNFSNHRTTCLTKPGTKMATGCGGRT